MCGGNAERWGLEPKFDVGAERVRQELRNQGVLTFSGVPFFMPLRPYRNQDGWHYHAYPQVLGMWERQFELEVNIMHLARKPRTRVGGGAYPLTPRQGPDTSAFADGVAHGRAPNPERVPVNKAPRWTLTPRESTTRKWDETLQPVLPSNAAALIAPPPPIYQPPERQQYREDKANRWNSMA